jgi:cytochrome c2
MGIMRLLIVTLLLALLSVTSTPARAPQQPRPTPVWADWIESDFPFFSSVLDARRAGPGFPTGNLTPRALVLRVGRDHWVGFDLDLLRVAAIWRGQGVTPTALAPGSYQKPDRKTPGGQTALPEPNGPVWLASGIYPDGKWVNAQAYGCVACHAVDSTSLTRLGPTWRGLYGSERTFAGGVVRVIADEAYLRESILQPAAKVVSGYERGEVSMPSYAGVLTDSQLDSLILFIKSLK